MYRATSLRLKWGFSQLKSIPVYSTQFIKWVFKCHRQTVQQEQHNNFASSLTLFYLILSPAASRGGGLRSQRRRPGWRLGEGWIMSPNGAGSDPDCRGFIWSGLVLRDLPPLSCGRMGRPGRPVTEILQKRHIRDTCSFSHHLCQSHREGREGKGGEGEVEVCLCRVPGVNSASHTCWTLEIAYLYDLCQLSGRGRIWGYECVSVVHSRLFQTSFPSFLFSSPQAPILRCGLFKVTLQCSTRCDFIVFCFFSLFNPVKWQIQVWISVGLHHVCPGQGDTVGLLV